MSKPKHYTIKVKPENDELLVAQANEAHTYPTTLLQEFVNNVLATQGKLVSTNFDVSPAKPTPAPPPTQNFFAANAEIKRLQTELQTATAQLEAHKSAIEIIIKNAQAQFPISRKQLLKNVAI